MALEAVFVSDNLVIVARAADVQVVPTGDVEVAHNFGSCRLVFADVVGRAYKTALVGAVDDSQPVDAVVGASPIGLNGDEMRAKSLLCTDVHRVEIFGSQVGIATTDGVLVVISLKWI